MASLAGEGRSHSGIAALSGIPRATVRDWRTKPPPRRQPHETRVERYPGIIAECVTAVQALMPNNRVHVQQLPYRAVVIGCYSKAWPLMFPQHGPGLKHKRKIELVQWQQEIVDCFPREFLRGLINSDGCRVLNRVNGFGCPPRPRRLQVSQAR